MKYQILQGDNRETLKTISDNSIDAIVTDPPYGIDFLGKSWDANTGALETYQECLRVLKPGGHILAFSSARTYHHLAITLEQAGFEIRDQIMWIYSSGFPKSQDIGRQLHKKANGKPDKQRFDPAVMISLGGDKYSHPDTDKVYRALPDINGDRLAVSHEGKKYGTVYEEVIEVDNEWTGWGTSLKPAHEPCVLARKPLAARNIRENCENWGVGALNIDATRVGDPITYTNQSAFANNVALANNGEIKHAGANMREEVTVAGRFPSNVLGEIPEYQKYFYCPKVSRKERHMGIDNNHPTVKPIALMEYLIKLITPPGGTVLDPFNGSGSTGCAAVGLGYNYIGCELDPRYVEITHKRIEAWLAKDQPQVNPNFKELFDVCES